MEDDLVVLFVGGAVVGVRAVGVVIDVVFAAVGISPIQTAPETK